MSKSAGRLIEHMVSCRGRETNGKFQWRERSHIPQKMERVVEGGDAFPGPQRQFPRGMRNVALKRRPQLFDISRVNFRMLAGEVHLADNFGACCRTFRASR